METKERNNIDFVQASPMTRVFPRMFLDLVLNTLSAVADGFDQGNAKSRQQCSAS
jgi:hypothetical protein